MKRLPFWIGILVICCALPAVVSTAAPIPKWVRQRPNLPDYYVGIGMAAKKSGAAAGEADYRQKAKGDALFDLAQEISVSVSGRIVDKIVEKTGLSEQTVRSEIQTFSKAQLQGHERVDQWETGDACWVYYRLSKRHYARLHDESRRAALHRATDMHKRSMAAAKNQQILSALRFDHEALQQISPFMGEPLEAKIDGNKRPLGNAIFAHLQELLTAIQLAPLQPDFPVLKGHAAPAEISVAVSYGVKNQTRINIAQLPLALRVPWKSATSATTRYTDQQGVAHFTIRSDAAEDGANVDVELDVKTLLPSPDQISNAFVEKLGRPRSAVRIQLIDDKEQYLWRREFQNRKVSIAAAYQVDGAAQYWLKFNDEMMQCLERAGARVVPPPAALSAEKMILMSTQPESNPPAESPTDAEIFIVLTAVGKKNPRSNPRNRLGEEVQFEGEFSTLVLKQGRTTFSDRYRAMSGWNPLGMQMCMDVGALHAFKRWKTRYQQHLSN